MSSSQVSERDYRTTIGLFATGVTVLLAERNDVVHGMTCNAVTSLSLRPTQLIVCPSRDVPFAAYLDGAGHFTVNILSEQQERHSDFFAGERPDFPVDHRNDEPPFALVPWPKAGRAPRLSGCVASIGCRVHGRLDGGDHWIVVGDVVALHRGSPHLRPLLFFGGAYHHPSRTRGARLDSAFDPYA